MLDAEAGSDVLGRVVDALHMTDGGLDGPSIAELLWLAAVRGEHLDEGGAREEAGSRPPDDAEPEADGEPEEGGERPGRTRTEGGNRLALYESTATEVRTTGALVAGVPAARNGSLAKVRELARALKPFKRPWPRGRRRELDLAATVADYARSGELIPAFRPAPERWFDATVVLDRSPTMAVWSGTVDALLRLLTRAGVFRTLKVLHLDSHEPSPDLRGPLGQRVVGGGSRAVQPRRLTLVVSDCVSTAWAGGGMWDRVHDWAQSMPVALLNPLPPKMWRSTGLDLPAVRVTSTGPPGMPNSRLRFTTPILMEAAFPDAVDPASGWQPLPVMSLTPRAVGAWSRMLMRSDTDGCGALLLPGPGIADRPAEPADAAVDGESVVEAFLHRASPPATRLAVLCSPYPHVNVDLLRLLQQELVPDATAADLAEFVVGGLVTVDSTTGQGSPVLRFRDGVRPRLESRLGARDAWRMYDALEKFIATEVAASSRLPAAVAGTQHTSPASVALAPFTEASARTLRALGVTVEEPTEARTEEQPARDGTLGTAPLPRHWGRSSSPRPAAEHRPYFFLSYAHTPRYSTEGPDRDMWVEKLFRDLSGHVMAMTDLPAGAPAGFMDREIRSGEGLSERLGEALASCRVFVPLFSPRYFASEMCGKEWYAFAQRAIYHQAMSNSPAEAIVPALWVPTPPEQLPGPAERLQFNHRAMGDRYVTDGLYGLIKLRFFQEEYERAVYELAKRIVRVANETLLGSGSPVDYREAPSAFGRPGGARPMHVTVAAPTRHDLPDGRASDYYGEEAQDWNPYHPHSARPLAYVAQDLMRSLNYQVTVSSFDREALPDKNRPPTRPEILLVDRWALEDDHRRQRLAVLDAEPRPWMSIVVPWNRDDPQSRVAERELVEKLERILPNHMRQGRAACRAAARGVPSMEAFGQILPQVVESAAQEYLRHAQVYPPVDYRQRPRLRGPMAPPPYTEAVTEAGLPGTEGNDDGWSPPPDR